MQKYRHCFEEVSADNSTFIYKSGKKNARIDFLSPKLYRVALWTDGNRLLPTWAVSPEDTPVKKEGRERLSTEGFPMFVPTVTEKSYSEPFDAMGNNKKIFFSLPDTDVILSLPCFSLEVRIKGETPDSGRLLFADRAFSPYNYEGELGPEQCHFISAERYETILGLGEKAGNVNRFGQSFIIGARDSMGYDASSTDPLYKHLPYYICRNSVGTYGIYYDTHAKSTLNFMKEMDNYYDYFKSFSTEDEVLVYYVFLGSVKEIAESFARLCGRNSFSPKWSLDYNGSTMSYTDAPDADRQLRGFLEKCRRYDFKCSAFYLSSGYTSIKDKRYVFNWNTDKIPDPKDLISTFLNAGVHFIPNIKPAFLEDHPMYEMIASKGWFLHYEDGTPAKLPFWGGYGSYLDFTNPGAFDFWTEMAKEKLIDYGIDALWNDNNEYFLSDRDIMAAGFGTPIPAYRICQVFPMLMVMASNAAFKADGKRHFMSTRSGAAGINRLAQTWTGDNYSSFRDLYFNHKMALNMSISNMPLFGHDLGGFSGPAPKPELLLRWLSYGALLPRFCIHSWNDGGAATEPWMYPECTDSIRDIYRFRNRIKPQLYQLLYRVHANYDTFITPLFVDYPDVDVENDTFMLGHDVVAGCVFKEAATTVTMTLPGKDGWYADPSLDAKERYFNPGDYTFENKAGSLPCLLHKAGSAFLENTASYSAADDTEELLLRVYACDSGEFTYDYFEDDGISEIGPDAKLHRITFCCERDAVRISGVPKNIRVHLVDKQNRKLYENGR